MSARERPWVVTDRDQHDVDEHQLCEDPCGKANGSAPSVFQCDKAQPDIQQQRENLGGQPGIHEGILADADSQRDGRDDQQRIHDMRHDPGPALAHDGRAVQLPDAAQKEQQVAGRCAGDMYGFEQQGDSCLFRERLIAESNQGSIISCCKARPSLVLILFFSPGELIGNERTWTLLSIALFLSAQ